MPSFFGQIHKASQCALGVKDQRLRETTANLSKNNFEKRILGKKKNHVIFDKWAKALGYML